MSIGLGLFTILHVAVSLVGIGAGAVVAWGLLGARPLNRWTTVFLVTTLATSVSGFGFPSERFLPSHAIGLISIVVLGVAVLARDRFKLANAWRATYVVSVVLALYFNVFVLIVQAFLKVPALTVMAPTQSELPFLAAQLAALAFFLGLGTAAVFRFRPAGAPSPAAL